MASGAAGPLGATSFAGLMAPLGPFERTPRIAVAVSGGADSMALALLADVWARGRGGEAVALTVDHRLRPDSTAEARRVRRWLVGRGLRHVILPWTGTRPDADVQAAARAARYRLLAEWCRRRGILHLLLAHHRDDQAETLLLRLARGSGLDGLAAMAPVGEAVPDGDGLPGGPRLLRPLLGVPKAALEASLRARGQDWIEDPSNVSDAFARARLRRLMPALAGEGLTPERLAATASRLARARSALDDATAALAAAAVALYPAGYARIDLRQLRRAAPEVALRCLARCLMTVGAAHYTPRLERLERLHAELCAPGAEGVRTLAGCRVEARAGRVLVCREAAAVDAESWVAAGAEIRWDGRFLLRLGGRGRVRLARLGTGGWAEILAARPELRGSDVPGPARPALPALRDRHGLLEVPHLGFRRAGAGGPRVTAVEFAPRHALAPARFMVV